MSKLNKFIDVKLHRKFLNQLVREMYPQIYKTDRAKAFKMAEPFLISLFDDRTGDQK